MNRDSLVSDRKKEIERFPSLPVPVRPAPDLNSLKHHLISKHFFSAYLVPGSLLGMGSRETENQLHHDPCPCISTLKDDS